MGRWGEGLFEGDDDLDAASDISLEAGIELFSYDPSDDPDDYFGGEGLEATQAYLDSGVFNDLFEKYRQRYGGLMLVWLAALAMRVGAKIKPEQLDILRAIVPTLTVSPKYSSPISDSSFRAKGKFQIEAALKHYRNDGTPFDFDAERCNNSGCQKAKTELGKEDLFKCAKCNLVSYCGKPCQDIDGTAHKSNCRTPEQRDEEQMRRNAGRDFISMNV